ncbi:MAG: hypothetical protein PUE58_07430 [Lachnospiraceae bacterium]|nr:hypothetical protein [Lachnospiraceae bacterium]
MSARIPITYLKRQEGGYIPVFVIEAPANTPELSGYVMKIPQDKVEVTDTALLLQNGNEWSKKDRKYYFMFEKEEKVKGHPAKRYRYSEQEFVMLYGRAESKTFDQRLEKRIKRSQTGPGRLLKASYCDYEYREMKVSTDWLIGSDSDQKWAYEFSYDPLRDTGKHSLTAKGFSVIEEYPVPDISILVRNKGDLPPLLHRLDRVRMLKLAFPETILVYDRSGSMVNPKSIGEAIAFFAYDLIPSEAKQDKMYYGTCAKPEAEELLVRLNKISTEMEIQCLDFLDSYRSEQLNELTAKIKELTGINMLNVLEK